MNKKMVIGMDCGASHSSLKIWENGLVPVERHDLPGANFDLINQEKNRERLMLEFAEMTKFENAFWVVGMAGLDGPSEVAEAEIWFRELLDKTIPYSGLKMMSDSDLLLWAGGNRGAGIGLVAGTGSACFARNEEGKTKKVGGMSHLLSDEGGGFSLGWKCLHLITKMVDGRVVPTGLQDEVFSFYGQSDLVGLKNFLLGSDQKIEIARCAPLLLSAAERGEEAAGKLVLEEANELVKMVLVVNEFFELKILPVYLAGSVFKNKIYRDQFIVKLHSIYPEQKVKQVSPIDGAWLFVEEQQSA